MVIKGILTNLLLVLLLFTSQSVVAKPLVATIDIDVKKDYDAFLAGRDPLTITDYSGEHSRRDVVEIILMLQALQLGGFTEKLDLKIVQGYDHSLQLVTAGIAVIRGSPLWGSDAFRYENKLYISDNLVKPGRFNVGFYTSPNNQKALASKHYRDLLGLTAVSSRAWVVDWRTLKKLKINTMRDIQTWRKMVETVSIGKGDFTLAPFQPTADLSLEVFGHRLIPIPNIKVSLDGTRHWIVAKQHKKGAEVFKALRKGIDLMIAEDRIERAYTESGFYHPKVKDWHLITAN